MSNKDKSNDDSLFKQTVGKVTQIKNDKANLRPVKREPLRVRQENWRAQEAVPMVSSADVLSFGRKTCSPSLLLKLKRGKIHAEENIDLHGMRIDEAKAYLDNFLDECVANESLCVCVVHGKGRKNAEHPILKNKVNVWLRADSRVLAFHSAPVTHGGTGAVFVLLN